MVHLDQWTWLALPGAGLLLLLFARRPLLWLVRLLLRSSVWLGLLALLAGNGLPLLGVNPLNALFLGLLGLPGLGLLLLLRWTGGT